MSHLDVLHSKSIQADGYTVIRNLFSDEDLQPLKIHLENALAYAPSDAEKASVKRDIAYARGLYGKDDLVKSVISKVLHLLDPLGAKSDLAVVHDEVVLKLRHGSRIYPWHQDTQYFPVSLFSLVVALYDLDADKGSFEVVPGSHSFASTSHEQTGKIKDIPEDDSWPRPIKIKLNRGDVLLVDTKTIHRGLPNFTDSTVGSYTVVIGPSPNH